MKKIFKFSGLLFFAFMLSSCATVHLNYTPTHTDLRSPNINTEHIANIGDALLEQGEIVTEEFLNVLAQAGGTCYTIPVGEFPKRGANEGTEFYDIRGTKNTVIRKGICDPITNLSISADKPSRICVITVFRAYACYDATYNIIKKDFHAADTIHKALYFSGKEKDEVLLMYTETRGTDVIHTHDVSYNIKKSPIIRYKGAVIKVKNSNSNSITYEVLKHFSE